MQILINASKFWFIYKYFSIIIQYFSGHNFDDCNDIYLQTYKSVLCFVLLQNFAPSLGIPSNCLP